MFLTQFLYLQIKTNLISNTLFLIIFNSKIKIILEKQIKIILKNIYFLFSRIENHFIFYDL